MGADREASLVLQMPPPERHLQQLLYGSWKEGSPYAKGVHVFSRLVFQCWMDRMDGWIGADCSCLIQQIPEAEGDAGCLTQGVMTCRRGNTLSAPMEPKEEAAGRERESACLHAA